ncbi:hypothetical protein GCM10010390_28960 [Streptomyces mordarskii]|uniref:Uncharacterized protein n=1 Tax=Streptomyces mordarskii TaxID=1226758 RepID=A0ABN1CS18_9ACTN
MPRVLRLVSADADRNTVVADSQGHGTVACDKEKAHVVAAGVIHRVLVCDHDHDMLIQCKPWWMWRSQG